MIRSSSAVWRAFADHARPIDASLWPDDELIERLAPAQVVLLGEASHGTEEFYRFRMEITRRLIEEHGFAAVAIEGDWPDAYRVHRYLQGRGGDESANAALGDFRRFPRWMWRNREVVELVDWLHAFNADREPARRVGFYGLDLYSLHASMEAVVAYLDRVDPDAAGRARLRYGCFDRYGDEPQRYGYQASLGLDADCQRDVIEQLTDLRSRSAEYLRRDGLLARDEQFFAEQNAVVVRDAERYYREMFGRGLNTWNLRDRHMAETLEALRPHLAAQGGGDRVIVWAHNSHVGDARATAMGRRGELNIGELVRKRHGGEAVSVGFTTHHGTVTAASDWGEDPRLMSVNPSRPDSWEHALHDVGEPRFWVPLGDGGAGPLGEERLERAIGVIYRPESERANHYFHAALERQFDIVVHIDRTAGIRPLDATEIWSDKRVPETYPFGT